MVSLYIIIYVKLIKNNIYAYRYRYTQKNKFSQFINVIEYLYKELCVAKVKNINYLNNL